jgi:deazaflavin-dependent oxidoreductase (nitroreductase family)
MKGTTQNALRMFTRVMRPLALRSAGQKGTATSVVRHVGRRSGRTYQTPVTVARHDDSFLIALPYGERTDWLKNVLAAGSATITTDGNSYDVDRPEVIPMAELTGYFRPRDQRMQRQFHVDTALQLRQRREDSPLADPAG